MLMCKNIKKWGILQKQNVRHVIAIMQTPSQDGVEDKRQKHHLTYFLFFILTCLSTSFQNVPDDFKVSHCLRT